MATAQSNTVRCSFCGKRNDEVRRLIAGPNLVFICDECVARCNGILAAEESRDAKDGVASPEVDC